MIRRGLLRLALVGTLPLQAHGQALPQEESDTQMSVTAPSQVSPFDPDLLERIRLAITERMRGRLIETLDE
jgi:hypothetical protein